MAKGDKEKEKLDKLKESVQKLIAPKEKETEKERKGGQK